MNEEIADATQEDELVELTDNSSLPEDGDQSEVLQESISEDAVLLDDDQYEVAE